MCVHTSSERVRETTAAVNSTITHSECVSVALIIQYAKMRRVMSSEACRAPSHFPHYLINSTIFGKKVT